MKITRVVVLSVSLAVMVLCAGVVAGQSYPSKPIRIITGAVGGGSDLPTRLIAQGISGPLGQPAIVENRGGGAASIEALTKAPPDGYTLLLIGDVLYLQPLLQYQVSWDPVRDFSPITLAATTPSLLVVHPSLPVKSVKELIAFAKARPGDLNYGSGGIGGPSHLAGELFKAMAGVNIVAVNYKGTTPAINALITGDVQLTFANAGVVTPYLNAGRTRALAVSSAQPSALAPGLPTIAASGLPGYSSETSYFIMAPAKTPEAIIKRLNQEIVRVLNSADVKEKLLSTGSEAVSSSPEDLAAKIKFEMTRMGKVINDAHINTQ